MHDFTNGDHGNDKPSSQNYHNLQFPSMLQKLNGSPYMFVCNVHVLYIILFLLHVKIWNVFCML